ncbi:MAG: hypothetical protein JW915_17965 [Chitinispirillaceae bacterium]|nr:hypothetical protein [Chitinispirillaceae bacterium]
MDSRSVSDGNCDCNVDGNNADTPYIPGIPIGRDKACLVSTDETNADETTDDIDYDDVDSATIVFGENHADPTDPTNPAPKQPPLTIPQKRFRNQGKNTVSSMVDGYVSAVTHHAHRAG